jgi:hypothetical protein
MLSVVMLNVVFLIVVMLNVVAPLRMDPINKSMVKREPTGPNLGQVFNCRRWRIHGMSLPCITYQTAKLRVENSTQATFRFSPVRYRAPWLEC